MEVKHINQYIDYIPKCLSRIDLSDVIFPQQRDTCTVFGKKYLIPRDQIMMHFDKPYTYRYSNITLQTIPVDNDSVKRIREYIYKTFNIKYNVVLINRYTSPNDKVGWHSDDEKMINQNFPIISISLGQSRKFQIKDKSTKAVESIKLNDGDIIVMKSGCQQLYSHQVPKGLKNETGIRYNLTFRIML